jgi:hypothetical protein
MSRLSSTIVSLSGLINSFREIRSSPSAGGGRDSICSYNSARSVTVLDRPLKLDLAQ